jgi:hypothetical protein
MEYLDRKAFEAGLLIGFALGWWSLALLGWLLKG